MDIKWSPPGLGQNSGPSGSGSMSYLQKMYFWKYPFKLGTLCVFYSSSTIKKHILGAYTVAPTLLRNIRLRFKELVSDKHPSLLYLAKVINSLIKTYNPWQQENKVLRSQLELGQVRQEIDQKIREKEEDFANTRLALDLLSIP